MQMGVHIIERKQLDKLGKLGARVPAPWMGVLDLGRTVEGHLENPTPGQPLGVVGLETLLEAADEEAGAAMHLVRKNMHAAKHYFEWKKIPLVFLIEGKLSGRHDEDGPTLEFRDKEWSLRQLLGRGLKPKFDDHNGWWWSPQIG